MTQWKEGFPGVQNLPVLEILLRTKVLKKSRHQIGSLKFGYECSSIVFHETQL